MMSQKMICGSTLIFLTLLLLHCVVFAQSNSVAAQPDNTLHIIVFGAHPDDCELKVGGMAARWAAQGHKVKFVSTTNGDIGHAVMAGGPLAKRRTAEVQESAHVLGIESQVLDIHDGELMPTLENRKIFIKLIREWKADIVISHRPNDYHPDHRYTGILMQDAAFMVTVTNFCPDVPQLAKNPVFLYMSDNFQKPNPFDPSIVVPIDDVFEQKMKAIWKLESQIESLWATGNFEAVVPIPQDPVGREKRFQELVDRQARRDGGIAEKFRIKLIDLVGKDKAANVKCAEAFELCEYGRQPNMEELKKLFLCQ
jgi:N-acetylglucosamine malate deacetylase 1